MRPPWRAWQALCCSWLSAPVAPRFCPPLLGPGFRVHRTGRLYQAPRRPLRSLGGSSTMGGGGGDLHVPKGECRAWHGAVAVGRRPAAAVLPYLQQAAWHTALVADFDRHTDTLLRRQALAPQLDLVQAAACTAPRSSHLSALRCSQPTTLINSLSGLSPASACAEIWSPTGGFFADPKNWRRNFVFAAL